MYKHTLIFIAVILITVKTNGQAVGIGIKAGSSVGNSTIKENGNLNCPEGKFGLYSGVYADIAVDKKIAIQSGLNFVQIRVTEISYTEQGRDEKPIGFNYLEIPLNALWYFRGPQKGFCAGIGATVSFAVGGNISNGQEGQTHSRKINFGDQESDDFKSRNMGINLIGAYIFKNGLRSGIECNLGLINLSNSSAYKFHNNYATIYVGYVFRKKKK